jgi:ABC-type transport system involved in multi-copper enzyme maturation permease subunit
VFLPAAAAVTLVCFLVIVVRLRKPPAETDRLPAGAELVEGERRSIGRKVMFLIDDKKARKPVGSFNPVAGKERKTNALRSGRWMIRLFYGALVLSLGLAVMALYGGVEYGNLLAYVAMILIALQLGLVALVDPSLTSPAVSSEMETGTFETLRLTPLSGGQIFWGKLLPLVPAAMLPVLALLPAYGAVWFVDDSYGTHFLYLLPVVVLAVLFSLATALACSTFVNNTARATVAAYLIVAALFILPMLAWFASGTHINADIARWLAMPSPLVMGMNLLPTGSSAIVDLWETHLIVMGSLIVLLLIVARTRLAALLRQG